MINDPHAFTYLGGIACHPDFDFATEYLKGKLGEKHVELLRAEARRAHEDNAHPNEIHQRLLAVSRRFVEQNEKSDGIPKSS